MTSMLVRLRGRNQMTLPAKIAEHLSLGPNALVELTLNAENGHLELRRAEVVRAGTARAKRTEELSLKNAKEGRFTTFANPEELARNLEETRARTEMEERVESLQQQVEALAMSMQQLAPQTVRLLNTPTTAKRVKVERRRPRKSR
jgi:bifunctional DNA-binding transcriptional regulator/antitoxin component of YhaV-PrlF toxin-antitoxin module